MRHRPRLLLIVATSLALAGGCSVNVEGGDYSDPEVEPRREPRAAAREYCALVEEFYERLGAFQDRALGDLGDEATDDALDRRFVGFVREQQQLFERLAAAAPAEIAAAATTQAEAFAAVAADGNLDPLETDAAEQAEDRTVEYEERECGIVVR
jgi:transcriptional regulator with GAF, ATPase, and Fis domain